MNPANNRPELQMFGLPFPQGRARAMLDAHVCLASLGKLSPSILQTQFSTWTYFGPRNDGLSKARTPFGHRHAGTRGPAVFYQTTGANQTKIRQGPLPSPLPTPRPPSAWVPVRCLRLLSSRPHTDDQVRPCTGRPGRPSLSCERDCPPGVWVVAAPESPGSVPSQCEGRQA